MTTKKERIGYFYDRFQRMGFSFDDINKLRRIEMTLSRWSEAECNGEIQRDETTDKPYRYYGVNMERKYPIADREVGAMKRLDSIMTRYPQYTSFLQGDPRGCSLYIIPKDKAVDKDVSSCYSSIGHAVCY